MVHPFQYDADNIYSETETLQLLNAKIQYHTFHKPFQYDKRQIHQL